MLKDADMRHILIEKIVQQNTNLDYRIIPEMAICDGKARVDIAVANGNLYGYEIKSDADTLDRLAVQLECYNRTFDKAFIVVGSKFEDTIEKHVSPWWGIYVIKQLKNGMVRLSKRREAKTNPEVDTSALLELLWRDETALLLNSNGITGISKMNRRILRRMALEIISKQDIHNYCRETLKYRNEWRGYVD